MLNFGSNCLIIAYWNTSCLIEDDNDNTANRVHIYMHASCRWIGKHCYCFLQVSSALDKLSTRERFLNSQCRGLTTDYAEAKEHLLQLQKQYNQKQDAVAQQDMELAQIMKVKVESMSLRSFVATQTLMYDYKLAVTLHDIDGACVGLPL